MHGTFVCVRDKGVGVKLFIKGLSVGYWLDWDGKINRKHLMKTSFSFLSLMIFSSRFLILFATLL